MNLSMVRQAMALKSKMEKVKKELAKEKIENTQGDGLVTVTVNGLQKVLSIKIDSSAKDASNTSKLEKLILKALNGALEESKKLSTEKLGAVTGGLKIPGITD